MVQVVNRDCFLLIKYSFSLISKLELVIYCLLDFKGSWQYTLVKHMVITANKKYLHFFSTMCEKMLHRLDKDLVFWLFQKFWWLVTLWKACFVISGDLLPLAQTWQYCIFCLTQREIPFLKILLSKRNTWNYEHGTCNSWCTTYGC